MSELVETTKIEPQFEKLEFNDRYYIQTAKGAIESLGQIVAEAGSNEDEAIWRRSQRDSTPDEGRLHFRYDPVTQMLSLTGDGAGMTAAEMRARLLRVGAEAQKGARRGFFHRGIREVFLAMGGGRVTSIGRLDDGREVISEAVFDPHEGMAMIVVDAEPTSEQRADLALIGTGARVIVPMKRFVHLRPNQFEFNRMEQQIKDCVGIRPVLTDSNREVLFSYGNEPPRRLKFEYEQGEDLIAERDVTIGGYQATIWVKVAATPIKGLRGKQMRRSGILIRGERAAYEVSTGDKLSQHPAMPRIFGELHMDAIEEIQRKADETADDESQLVYKTDRSGLNPEHPVAEAIYKYIDDTLGSLIADLDSGEQQRNVSSDMRRQLAKLARVINQVVKEEIQSVEDPGGKKTDQADKNPPDKVAPEPGEEHIREVEDGVGFARGRIFIDAGQSRTVEVWFDSALIPVGTSVTLKSPNTPVVPATALATDRVPAAGKDGIATIDLTIYAGNTEGRHELRVSAADYEAALAVHVRFPRAAGFISNIIPVDEDWESGSALWDPSTGVVKVFVGRPEFKDAAARAKRDGDRDVWKSKLYRQLVVESVREAALWPAAERHAEEEWDELSFEERQGDTARLQLVRTAYQELDYRLRAKLLRAFVDV